MVALRQPVAGVGDPRSVDGLPAARPSAPRRAALPRRLHHQSGAGGFRRRRRFARAQLVRRAAGAGTRRPGSAGGAAAVFLEKRQVAAEHRIPQRRCTGLLGSPRLSQPRRSVGRAALFQRLAWVPEFTSPLPQGESKTTMEADVPTERFQFTGVGGHQLAAALDLPEGEPLAYALFAHCFTCGKDVLAAKRIAVALAAKGIAVLRFDFTGLGSSEGDFANSTFSSNVADLVRAADHLRETRKGPAILIGHSLGGSAILAAAGQIPDAKAVVTIAAPSDPAHVTGLFRDRIEDIRKHGKVQVSLAGRPFHITREFLDDIAEHGLMAKVTNLHKALLIMHSPTDDTVGIDNATRIFVAAKHPKSFVSLAGADHLLSERRDAAYVADVIGAWATRYLEPIVSEPAADLGKAPR